METAPPIQMQYFATAEHPVMPIPWAQPATWDVVPAPLKVCGIIPARGNSKGIPRKNMKLLGGKPLIQWTIECGREAGLDLIVTTEDQEIADFAARFEGVRVMMRPEYLSQDIIQLDQVYLNVLQRLLLEGNLPGLVVLLTPTCPFRNPVTIRRALELYSPGSTVLSLYPDRRHHWQAEDGSGSARTERGGSLPARTERGESTPARTERESEIVPVFHNPERRYGRQWTDSWLYVESGSVYVLAAERLLETGSQRNYPFFPVYETEREGLDLDEPLDWLIAEQLLAGSGCSSARTMGDGSSASEG